MARRNRGNSRSPSSIAYRRRAARGIPTPIGVYALCDLDNVPLYIGNSVDGIRKRVQHHITSARSDIIANRMVDVWEIAYVWCWPVDARNKLIPLESVLFHRFHPRSPLMNGSIPRTIETLSFDVGEPTVIQLLPDEEIMDRRRIELRLPRQVKHFGDLLDHFLTVKDSRQLHLALKAHFSRLQKYFENLRAEPKPPDDQGLTHK